MNKKENESWPKNDQTWSDFMSQSSNNEEGIGGAKVPFLVACMILAAYVIFVAVEVLDHAAK